LRYWLAFYTDRLDALERPGTPSEVTFRFQLFQNLLQSDLIYLFGAGRNKVSDRFAPVRDDNRLALANKSQVPPEAIL
jgi:hypothetical protein